MEIKFVINQYKFNACKINKLCSSPLSGCSVDDYRWKLAHHRQTDEWHDEEKVLQQDWHRVEVDAVRAELYVNEDGGGRDDWQEEQGVRCSQVNEPHQPLIRKETGLRYFRTIYANYRLPATSWIQLDSLPSL